MGESKLFEGVISLQFHYFSSFETPTSSNLLKKSLKKTSLLCFLSFYLQVCLSMYDLLLLHSMNGHEWVNNFMVLMQEH